MSVLSWGKSGQVEVSAGWGDTTELPEGAGISSAASEHLVATNPDQFNRPVKPDADHSQGNWNAGDIFNNTRIG
jgi:hypothetical protein